MLLYGKILREVKGICVWQDRMSIMSAQSVICYLPGEILHEVKVHTNPHLINVFLDPIMWEDFA